EWRARSPRHSALVAIDLAASVEGKTGGAAVANPGMSRRRTTSDPTAPISSVAEWRCERLLAAGFAPRLAAQLATDCAVDLHAVHFEIARRRRALGGGPATDSDDLALQAADDALMSIMSKLHTFRGDSRFTTWAYKFALLEAGVKVRRRTWQGREVPLEPDR